MAKAPSLVSLGMEAIKRELLRGDDVLPDTYELPSHLFNVLVMKLPPLALEKLQSHMQFEEWNDYETADGGLRKRKRGRNGNFNKAWEVLFGLRWPELKDHSQPVDWQQIYWETHLQDCLDEAAEFALLLSFDGCIGEMKISEKILKNIGCEGHMNNLQYSKLSYHCQQFGQYARHLRLPSVLCVAETCQLLRKSKLQGLVVRWIRSKEHVEGLCKVLIQNSETLKSVEFIHCKLSSIHINEICDSLGMRSMQTHGIQHFSINTSSFFEGNLDSLPQGLVSLLSSGRSLSSLKFRDNHLDKNFARMLFRTLIDVSSSLSILDLSDNYIGGWLCNFHGRSSGGIPSSLGIDKSLQSLCVLKLRGNNLHKDDVESLRHAMVYMPNLEILDISDNPIEDDGIRSLLPYLAEAPEKCSPLSELDLENCDLSCEGVTLLLETLSMFKRPLNFLSLADNSLGSQVAGVLGKFLVTSIRALNIGGIGLGSAGFLELQKGMMEELKLVEINISKNRGGFETAKFLSKLISLAPELVAINAAYNLMPIESLTVICSALKVAKGNVESLDLTGNTWDHQPTDTSMLTEFQKNGRPILILPSSVALHVPYDDDP